MNALRYILPMTALLLSVMAMHGQACCSGGVPLSSGINLNHANPNEIQLQLRWNYNHLFTLMDGREILNDETRKRTVNAAILEGAYQVTERLSIAVMTSAVWQYREISSNGIVTNTTLARGMGDGILSAKYLVINQSKVALSVNAGAKLPLGKTDLTTKSGFSLPADMQPGTGAWDALLGFDLLAQHILIPGLGIQLNSTYRLTGTNPDFRQTQAYEFGNNWTTSLLFGKEFLIGKSLIDATIGSNVRYMTNDKVNQSPIPNTGGVWMNALGSVSYYFNPSLRITAGATVPYFRHLEGTQLTTSFISFVRLYWKFRTGKNQKL